MALSADGAFTFYRDVSLPAIERGEEWAWILRLKRSPQQLIGAISLKKGERINRGFWLALAWQRQGLMTEAVSATSDHRFDVLGFRVLRATKAVANTAFRRISERTGMRVIAVEEQDYVSGRLLTEVWELTADEWRNRRR